MLDGLEIWQLLVIAGAFLAAGTVKGVMGVGLPLVSVPVIAAVTDPATAITLMVVPNLFSTGWQAIQAGQQGTVLRRFWPQMIALVAGTLIGAQFLVILDPHLIARFLGVLVLFFVAIQVMPLRPTVSPRAERRIGFPALFSAGLVGGASSFFGPVVILYLVALNLAKDLFVSAVALFFFVAAIPLFASLAVNGLLDWDRVLTSAVVGAVPVYLGLRLGRRLRDHIPQAVFRGVLLAILTVIGIGLILRSLG